MSKTRHVWLLFLASLAVVLVAMIWLSLNALRLDEMHQSEAERERVDSRVEPQAQQLPRLPRYPPRARDWAPYPVAKVAESVLRWSRQRAQPALM